MELVDWRVYVFYFIFESFLLTYVGLGLLGVRRGLKAMFPLALLYSIALYIIRSVPLPFGLHTLVLTLILSTLIRFTQRVSWQTSITAALLGTALVAVGESILVVAVLSLLKMPVSKVLGDPWLRVGFGWLADWILIISAFLVARYRATLILAPEGNTVLEVPTTERGKTT